ncbi:hypothetical protein PILCRDRAFT_10613 [Piloderma croceum F 1598]|uniref:Uncharacterized protein n=1 Tax=Piloderma croceum (strain F 1598) TaxID=765440 RepID=A0A0C3BPI5_PILCF|nr:hypothetical protein PILCRDRAFT_10613 [Piloderma croceum F 1598]
MATLQTPPSTPPLLKVLHPGLNMLHHPNTPQGLIAYALQVTTWKAANPTEYSGGDEFAPYPSTPSTEAVGKGATDDYPGHWVSNTDIQGNGEGLGE